MSHGYDGAGHPLPPSLQEIASATLREALTISPDALLCVNQAGTIVQVNAQAAQLFGYPEAHLRGMPLEELMPFRFRERHEGYRQQYAEAPRTRPMGVGLQLFGLRQDRSEFPVDISLRPLLIDGALHTLAAVRDITALVASEQQRSEQARSLQVFTDLINLAPDAIFLRDPINRITFWNQGAQELYGWPAPEALGRISHVLLKTHFPPGKAAVDAALKRTGRWEGELTHTTQTGRVIQVESRQALIRDERGDLLTILEVNREMTERVHGVQAMQAAQTHVAGHDLFFQHILDALPGSMYLVQGKDARLVFANRATTQVWGAPWPAGRPMTVFLHTQGIVLLDPQGRALPEEQYATLRALRQGETVLSQQESIRRPDASKLPVLVYAVPLSLAEEPKATAEPMALVVLQDVTALAEANDLKDEFVSIAAHELRTPLTVLSGYADMLLRRSERTQGQQLSRWQQEALMEIKQATGRLALLTEDLLDVTRLQSGRLVLRPEPFNLVSLAQRTAQALQQTTGKHQIKVRARQEILVVCGDESRVEQILTNVIGNAIKYSPQGGWVRLTIEPEENGQQVLVQVQDQGIGIPAYQQAQIFGRFVRADNARAQGIRGTGLGLYLCRELAARQKGQLWFESEEGKGSTFFLTLPLAREDLQHPEGICQFQP